MDLAGSMQLATGVAVTSILEHLHHRSGASLVPGHSYVPESEEPSIYHNPLVQEMQWFLPHRYSKKYRGPPLLQLPDRHKKNGGIQYALGSDCLPSRVGRLRFRVHNPALRTNVRSPLPR